MTKANEKCSTSLITREMQVKTASHPLGWLGLQTQETSGLKLQRNWNTHNLLMGTTASVEDILVHQVAKTQSYLAIPLQHAQPTELKTYMYTQICPSMVIPTSFLTIHMWEPPKCPSANEQINRMWCIHTVEWCLENIMLSKRSHPPNPTCCLIALRRSIQNRQSLQTDSRSVVP